MTCSLEFKESELKEWQKLDRAIREQFKKRLAERLQRPCVDAARLSGMTDCYNIKLRNAGYRLVYQVDDSRIIVIVVAVGKQKNITACSGRRRYGIYRNCARWSPRHRGWLWMTRRL